MLKRSLNNIVSRRFYSPLPRGGPGASFKRGQRIIKPSLVNEPVYTQPYPTQVTNDNGILNTNDGIARILSEPTIVIERQIEMMNVFLGFEQANKYAIMDAFGNRIGRMEERDLGLFKMITRQVYRLHRPFHVDVFDNYDNHVLTIKRPFSFINSHIKAILPSSNINENDFIIGESIQSWHLWRRRYNLFKASDPENFDQFGEIDSRFLSFDFPVRDEQGQVIASVDRNWVGLGREFFTDSGVYIVRMDPVSFQGVGYDNVSKQALTLDQRAILLGNAVSIDFDYFSRHSNSGGLLSFGSYE